MLNDVSCVSLQQALRHQQTAFSNFFAGRAEYPTFKSKRHKQGAVNKMSLDVRKWHCPEYGADHDRDINAARNIKAVGLTVLACGEPVNPESLNAGSVP